jgi:hypothetical protein
MLKTLFIVSPHEVGAAQTERLSRWMLSLQDELVEDIDLP